jgi:Icc-related predicted phosphoesterase
MVTAVCFSDTHKNLLNRSFNLPESDFGIFAGDCCMKGDEEELRAFMDWYSVQPVKHKIFVPGNHDGFTEQSTDIARRISDDAGVILLINEGVTIDNISIFGTPIQPFFCNWFWNVRSGTKRAEIYKLIPDGLDVLITHCPPKGVLDMVHRGEHVGCPVLRNRIDKVLPRFHVFGHIHEDYGHQEVNGTMCINACLCDERYDLHHRAVMIDLDDNSKIITYGDTND